MLNANQDCFPVYWTHLVCWYVMVMTGCQQLKSSIEDLDTTFLSTLDLDWARLGLFLIERTRKECKGMAPHLLSLSVFSDGIKDSDILRSMEEARVVSAKIDKRLALAILGKPQIYWERMCNDYRPWTRNWLLCQLLHRGTVRLPFCIDIAKELQLVLGCCSLGPYVLVVCLFCGCGNGEEVFNATSRV
jgi:hypothetical protein